MTKLNDEPVPTALIHVVRNGRN